MVVDTSVWLDYLYHKDHPTVDDYQAASIYRKCRQRGLTIRKPNDCLIAHHCLSYHLSLLTVDGDFNHIAKIFPLKMVLV